MTKAQDKAQDKAPVTDGASVAEDLWMRVYAALIWDAYNRGVNLGPITMLRCPWASGWDKVRNNACDDARKALVRGQTVVSIGAIIDEVTGAREHVVDAKTFHRLMTKAHTVVTPAFRSHVEQRDGVLTYSHEARVATKGARKTGAKASDADVREALRLAKGGRK